MDIDVLQNLLDEKTDYQETTKSIFLKKLWIRFEEFKQRDTKLHNYEGSCKVKNGPCFAVNFSKKGHVFIAENSRLYLPFIFVNNPDGRLKSLFYCDNFMVNDPMARIFNPMARILTRALKTKPCPYKTLKRSLLKTSSRFQNQRCPQQVT